MNPLALLGGKPLRTQPFPRRRSIGAEEKRAADAVLDSGNLSQYLGTWSPDFIGGPWVQKLEKEWAAAFNVKHAVAVNSATSGLCAAVGALGLGPGDEVIVTPYTMSATASAILAYGATPIFADIDPETCCLSPESVRERISPRTKAIMAVDLFGHPADFDALRALADPHHLSLIEDAAQAPGARYHNRPAGCLGDIGVFSLNYHKTIHCGEGGVVVTQNDALADRLRLIRNHAEAVVKAKGDPANGSLLGFNYRMTEVQAAIATEQLKKLESLTRPRIEAADFFRDKWKNIPGLHVATVQKDCRHVYYLLTLQIDADALGCSRDNFVKALNAEGVPFAGGYVEPLYLEPIYEGRSFLDAAGQKQSYARGLCPVTEQMHFTRLAYTALIHEGLSKQDWSDIAEAVLKVADSAGALSEMTTR